MDYHHTPWYNDLLTRKCPCGGEPEVLMDFVDDFIVRCTKCHLSTHAHIEPEDAAAHWNSGSDIMPDPLRRFLDEPEKYLQGEVLAIHMEDDGFTGISHQSCDFLEAIIEYTDKKYVIRHDRRIKDGNVRVDHRSGFNPKIYCRTVKPAAGETIRFEKIVYDETGEIEAIVYRWNDTWLFIFVGEHELVLTRSSFDLTGKGWPAETEPSLFP